MKRAIYLLTLCLSIIKSNGQSKYFQPKDIIDKTKEFSGQNIWAQLKDKERIDGFTRIGDSIFGGEISCNIAAIKTIDINTFRVLARTKYAKDTNHVYYPLQVWCKDYNDCGVCYYGKIIVENANPKTFKYLGEGYATDSTHIFFQGKLLQDADAASFKLIDFSGQLLEEKDINTSKAIDDSRYFYYAMDKNNIYKNGQYLRSR